MGHHHHFFHGFSYVFHEVEHAAVSAFEHYAEHEVLGIAEHAAEGAIGALI